MGRARFTFLNYPQVALRRQRLAGAAARAAEAAEVGSERLERHEAAGQVRGAATRARPRAQYRPRTHALGRGETTTARKEPATPRRTPRPSGVQGVLHCPRP